MKPPEQPGAELWRQWHAAVERPDIHTAICDIHRRLDEQVERRGDVCWASGRCCNFDAFGHRLYATGLEIAWVLKQVMPLDPATHNVSVDLHATCPFQVNRLCSIHALRPTGCRIFFCQSAGAAWQQDVYETALAELRCVHELHGLPYRYMEWRAGLHAALKAGPAVASGGR